MKNLEFFFTIGNSAITFIIVFDELNIFVCKIYDIN